MAPRRTEEIPVYLFLGFLEGGKTTFINETLEDDYFNDGEKTLLISCEEGIEEYDEDKLLKESNTSVIYVEDEEDFTAEYLNSNILKYYPDRVLLEYNGMWNLQNMQQVLERTPLVIFQAIVNVNGETFDLYMNNMRSLAVEMFKLAELVVINRVNADSPRATWRRSIRAVNRKAQVLFDSMDPNLEEVEEELPYDADAQEIVLEDEDYGIWFIDAMEHPERYDGKTMVMRARVFKSIRMPKGTFVPGRHAMTCCADDIQFIGYLCHTNHAKSSTIKSLKNKMWVTITAEVKKEYNEQYKDEGPVLYAKRIEMADPPEEELVYF